MAAAVEARRLGITFEVVEASEPFATLVNFPRQKPIFTYPTTMTPAGSLQVSATVKEALVAELEAQVERAGIRPLAGRAERIVREGGRLAVRMADGRVRTARRVLVAIGRSGDFRMLGVPGEDRSGVYNRLHDPRDFAGREVLVVGGGDSALETAIALAESGARVTLSYRKPDLARPKPENRERLELTRRGAPDRLTLRLGTSVREIRDHEVVLATADGKVETVPNDAVFTMIGREAPLAFLRRSGLAIAGEMTPRRWIAMAAFLAFCVWLYDWKSGGFGSRLWTRRHWFPTNLPDLLSAAGGSLAAAARDPHT